MATVKYDIDAFVEDLKALRQREGDTAAFLNASSTFLERLVRDPACLPDALRVPAQGRNHATYTLHREAPGGEGISVTAVVWGPGDHAAPHDHHTWGLIGVVENAIEETRFRRLDDRSRDDWAQLERDWVGIFRPGQVSVLTPDVDEIHQMDNRTDRPTVEIHVYGHDLLGLDRCRFDPNTGKISRFVTQRYDN